jgi:hypothetical protein
MAVRHTSERAKIETKHTPKGNRSRREDRGIQQCRLEIGAGIRGTT